MALTMQLANVAISKLPFDQLVPAYLKKAAYDLTAVTDKVNASKDGAYRRVVQLEAPTGVGLVAIGTEPPRTNWKTGQWQNYNFIKYGIGVVIPHELLEDSQAGSPIVKDEFTTKKFTMMLSRAIADVEERRIAALWLNGDNASYSVCSTLGPTGVPMFSASQAYLNLSGTQSNKAAAWAAPTKTTLNEYKRLIRQFYDSQNVIVGGPNELELMCSDKLMSDYELVPQLDSVGDIRNVANRDVNPIQRLWGSLRVRPIRYWTTNLSYFLCDTKERPFANYMRKDLQIITKELDTYNSTLVQMQYRNVYAPTGDWTRAYGIFE